MQTLWQSVAHSTWLFRILTDNTIHMASNIYDNFVSSITQWIHNGLYHIMPPFWALMTELTIIGLVFLVFYALVGLFLVYAERKVCAFMQNRVDPTVSDLMGYFRR